MWCLRHAVDVNGGNSTVISDGGKKPGNTIILG
jgi:hypothetical protein